MTTNYKRYAVEQDLIHDSNELIRTLMFSDNLTEVLNYVNNLDKSPEYVWYIMDLEKDKLLYEITSDSIVEYSK